MVVGLVSGCAGKIGRERITDSSLTPLQDEKVKVLSETAETGCLAVNKVDCKEVVSPPTETGRENSVLEIQCTEENKSGMIENIFGAPILLLQLRDEAQYVFKKGPPPEKKMAEEVIPILSFYLGEMEGIISKSGLAKDKEKHSLEGVCKVAEEVISQLILMDKEIHRRFGDKSFTYTSLDD